MSFFNEGQQFIRCFFENKVKLASSAGGAAIGTAAAKMYNVGKQNDVAMSIGKRLLDNRNAIVHGSLLDKVKHGNAFSLMKTAHDTIKDTAAGNDLKHDLPWHIAAGAAAGSLAGFGAHSLYKQIKAKRDERNDASQS